MLKSLALVSFILVLAPRASSDVDSKDEAVSRAQSRIQASVDIDFAPYTFLNHSGKVDGYAVELLRAVARRSKLEIDIDAKPKEEVLRNLRSGKTDIMPLGVKSADAPDGLVFGDTHTVAYDAIFVRRDERAIRSEDDLAAKHVIVVAGGLAERHFAEVGDRVVISVANSIVDALRLLNSGHADAFVGPQIAGLEVIRSQELEKVGLAAEPRFGPYTYRFAFAVPSGQEALIEKLNEGLKAVVASGELRSVSEKWIRSLDPEVMRRLERQRHLTILVFIAIIVVVASTALVLIFKREVKRKTQSLVESERRFRDLVENLPEVVFRCSLGPGWPIRFLSDSLERLTGYSARGFVEPAAEARSLLSMVHPEDFGQVRVAGETLLANGRVEVDFRVITKTGEIKWIHARAHTTNDLENKPSYVDGILMDVTEQRRVADLLMKQQTKLASSARLSALGEMAGGIAHEINNPLAIINLRTHQLSQLAAKGECRPEEVMSLAVAIESTAIRISKIIKSLQTVARESEHDPFESVPLKAILNDTLELCNQRMKKHGIQVIVEDVDGIELECRRVQISQVLINLFNNAFDAVVGQERGYIHVSARLLGSGPDDHIEIAIVDSGTSIPRELAQKIFQPFFTTKGPGKGTGLGLSISKGLIEAHDGFIWLDTDHPTSRFVIVLPRRQTRNRYAGSPLRLSLAEEASLREEVFS